jgi:hypothetical protein
MWSGPLLTRVDLAMEAEPNTQFDERALMEEKHRI